MSDQETRDVLPCGWRYPSNNGRCHGSPEWHDGGPGKHDYQPQDRRGRVRRAADRPMSDEARDVLAELRRAVVDDPNLSRAEIVRRIDAAIRADRLAIAGVTEGVTA